MEKIKCFFIYLLSFGMGMINSHTLLLLAFPTTFFTGHSLRLAQYFSEGNWYLFFTMFLMLISFFIGSTLGPILIFDRVPSNSNRFTYFLLAFGTIMILLHFTPEFFIFYLLIPLMAGIQDGCKIIFMGDLIRTTFMSGRLAFAGFYLGEYIKGDNYSGKKFLFYLGSILSFILGAGTGFYLNKFKMPTTIFIGALYFIIAIYYSIFNRSMAELK